MDKAEVVIKYNILYTVILKCFKKYKNNYIVLYYSKIHKNYLFCFGTPYNDILFLIKFLKQLFKFIKKLKLKNPLYNKTILS